MSSQAIASVLTFVLALHAAAGEQTPTIEQSISLKRPDSPSISPDGNYVAYAVREANWKENAFETQIWIVASATGKGFQLTRSKKSNTAPQWSPDSKRLAFLSDRDGKRQVYLINPFGGEAFPLTQSETGVTAMEWSPDGRNIAFTATDADSNAMKERKEKYGDFVVVEKDYTHTHLWVIEVPVGASKAGKPRRLTEGNELNVGGFSWSPDSQRLAFSAAKDPDLGSADTSDIFVLTVQDKTVKKVVATKGPDRNPIWSPDGKWIAYETANGKEFHYYSNSRIAMVSAEGGAPTVLTEHFDEHPRLIRWGSDGLFFAAQDKTNARLYRFDPSSKLIESISGPNAVPSFAARFSLSADCRQTAFVLGDAENYPEVAVSPVKTYTPKQLTNLGEQLSKFRLAAREVISWKSTDGTTIEGVLLKPAGFDARKRHPLLVVIHGGPTGIDTPLRTGDLYYPLEQFVAKGALILRPNYRGSAGYGEKFRSLNVRNLGVGDYDDVISAVDFLIGKGLVDRDRVGAMGWSQGGYISAFITTFSDRFKAVSVGAGISNWMTYYVNTDIHPFTRQYLKATPWYDPEIYRKTSPISYLKTAKTPTLIQHGELDRRVPIPNAFELYQGLKDHGVPVKLVVYKGFGHGIDKPKQQWAVMEQNLQWFGRYIWDEDKSSRINADKSDRHGSKTNP
jgi:dipeptidyl aminopeptidase/acylaminoacyl peptidase